jgi:hypothetical protein
MSTLGVNLKNRRALLPALAVLAASGGLLALPSSANASISCVSWISSNGDRGELSCSANAGSRGSVQLEIFCTELGRSYWIPSGWIPIVSGQHVREWLSCPVGRVHATRHEKRYR